MKQVCKRMLCAMLAIVILLGLMPSVPIHTHAAQSGSSSSLSKNLSASTSSTAQNTPASAWPKLNTDLTHIVCYGQSFSVGADAPIYSDPAVNGLEIGNVNTAYSASDGSKTEETTSWINGHNLYLSFMGKPTNFLLKNMKLTYLKIWENTCNHSYSAYVTAPTCTEGGYTTYTCANCGDSYVDTFAEPTGHVSTSVENAKEATCVSDGYTGDTVCDACGAIIEPGLVIPATGEHEYGDWVIIRQPTTEETGLREHTCKLCGHTEQEVTEPIAATPGDANGDGKVNAHDARAILRTAAGLDQSTYLFAKHRPGPCDPVDVFVFLVIWGILPCMNQVIVLKYKVPNGKVHFQKIQKYWGRMNE